MAAALDISAFGPGGAWTSDWSLTGSSSSSSGTSTATASASSHPNAANGSSNLWRVDEGETTHQHVRTLPLMTPSKRGFMKEPIAPPTFSPDATASFFSLSAGADSWDNPSSPQAGGGASVALAAVSAVVDSPPQQEKMPLSTPTAIPPPLLPSNFHDLRADPQAWSPSPLATPVASPQRPNSLGTSSQDIPSTPTPQSHVLPASPLTTPSSQRPATYPPLSPPQRQVTLRPDNSNKNSLEKLLKRQDLYKTEICRSWRETGTCRYGHNCQFAHGVTELRPVYRHPKYKTELCRTFAQTGACPYGTRCRFIHYQQGMSRAGIVDQVTAEFSSFSLSEEKIGQATPKGSRLPFFQKLRRTISSEKK